MIALRGADGTLEASASEQTEKRWSTLRDKAARHGLAAFRCGDGEAFIFIMAAGRLRMLSDLDALTGELDALEAEAQATPRRMGLEWGPSTPRRE